MKKLETLSYPRTSMISSIKRGIPETWKVHTQTANQSISEKEEEVFQAITEEVQKEKARSTIVRRKISSEEYKPSGALFSSVPGLTRVIYIVRIENEVVPVEVYSREEKPLFLMSRRALGTGKRVRYSCKKMCTSELLYNAAEKNVLSALYVLEGKYRRLVTHCRKNIPGGERNLSLVYQLLSLSIERNTSVLDLSSVYVEEGKEHSALTYLPLERKKKSADEYLLFLIGLAIPTYTVMERAVILKNAKEGLYKENSPLEKLVKKENMSVILSAIAEHISSGLWKEKYFSVLKDLLMHI
ncbi:hypothetical protein NECID01_0419 [Nematocida sp. AWRm77]|nr:hypothetical protein NECID01_0419 [Nematocida sp. AWRm77]